MGKTNRKPKTIDWDAMELQAFNLRFEPISPQDKLRKARKLAITFRRYHRPLPNELVNASLMENDHRESFTPE